MMGMMDAEAQYSEHVRDLLHFATVLVGPHDAADVVHDAVTSTLARGSLEGVDDLRPYWFRAVANTAASWHRSSARRRRREERSMTARRSAPHDPATPDDARRLLRSLSPQQRTAVYLTYWLDWPVDRVAESMRTSEGSVKQHLARGRARLKEILDDDR